MNDGIIVLAGDGLISSRLILEAPGYKRQEVEIRNDLLNDQVIYLSEGISGNMKLQNLDFITSNSSPQLQDLAITKFANISKANQPFTISVFDAIGMNISNFRVVGKENIQEGFKIDIQNGIASFSLPNSLKPDKLKIISSGYFPQTIQPADWEEGNHLTINLEKIEIGTEFILSTLEFEQSTISFTDSTVIEELDRLADMLLNTNGLEIQLTGYTDNQGLVRENMELSTERATAVKNYLIAKGVEAERIEARGLGSANPIASNQSPETRKLNRRVEVAITKIGEE